MNSLEAMKMALRDLTMLCHHRTQETVEALRQAIEQAEEQDDLTAAYMSGVYDGKKVRSEWIGLTDDEIEDAWIEASDEYDDTISINNLGRILEAKLKEKNT
jgi:hypothetical protein